jgi:hypothetical protein
MKRLILPLVLATMLLAGCRGTQPYTSPDLKQVRAGYVLIKPVYLDFRAAYVRKDKPAIIRAYHRERVVCRVPDEIDKRDTIDPNVQLFQASIVLDNLCNAVESAYAYWAKQHGLPYDKNITPGRESEVFAGSDAGLEKIDGYLRHPASLS